jgi:hypothetical protein
MLQWNLISSDPTLQNSALDRRESLVEQIDMAGKKVRFEWSSCRSGKALGMKCLTIDTGAMRTVLLPERGMGIWKTWVQGIEFGWQSPVAGPVHPALVPIGDPSGIGWLEGFDELLARCGLLSNGAPDLDAHGKVLYPVHGRIANLPASSLSIHADPELGTLEVVGKVVESRFLIYTLELESRIRFQAGSTQIEIHDTVTNLRSTPGSMQLLYHINLGQGLLESGSKIVAPLKRLAPRDLRAAEGIHDWSRCQGPQSGFAEQVYYAEAMGNQDQWSEAMLCNADESLGYSVHFDRSTLPVVNFWKNTAALEDGYVLGIEPATGFPNTKSFEQRHGRVVELQGGESKSFHLKLQPHVTCQEVLAAKHRIEELQEMPCHIDAKPVATWSPAGASS